MKPAHILWSTVSIALLLTSCIHKQLDCDKWANGFRDDSETNIILRTVERNGPLMYLYGDDPKTGKEIEFYEGSGWISEIYQQFKPGDTIVKKKGSYIVIVKKKGRTLRIPLTCSVNGKVYNDK